MDSQKQFNLLLSILVSINLPGFIGTYLEKELQMILTKISFNLTWIFLMLIIFSTYHWLKIKKYLEEKVK